MRDKQKIKGVMVVNQLGCGSVHNVGENDITDIKVCGRQISDDGHITIIEVLSGDNIIEEISMNTPYILTYF